MRNDCLLRYMTQCRPVVSVMTALYGDPCVAKNYLSLLYFLIIFDNAWRFYSPFESLLNKSISRSNPTGRLTSLMASPERLPTQRLRKRLTGKDQIPVYCAFTPLITQWGYPASFSCCWLQQCKATPCKVHHTLVLRRGSRDFMCRSYTLAKIAGVHESESAQFTLSWAQCHLNKSTFLGAFLPTYQPCPFFVLWINLHWWAKQGAPPFYTCRWQSCIKGPAFFSFRNSCRKVYGIVNKSDLCIILPKTLKY